MEIVVVVCSLCPDVDKTIYLRKRDGDCSCGL